MSTRAAQYSTYTAGTQTGRAYLYGAEYQTAGSYDNGPPNSFHDHNLSCTVCYISTRENVVMVPALATPAHHPGLVSTIYGYLMASYHGHWRTVFECVNRHPQSVPGSIADRDGALFYHVEVRCNYGIPCPPYDTQKEVTCVVCTK